jgi:hypothetical protein
MPVSLEGMTAEAIADLAALAKGLADDPKTRPYLLNMMKARDPSLSIPEVDIPLAIAAQTKPQFEKLAKMEREIQEREIKQNIKDRRQALMKDKGLGEKEVAEVEKMMVEKGISNHDTAADFYLSQRSAAQPTPSTFSQPSIPKPDLKKMGMNINQWSRNEATEAITDIIKNRGRAA